MRKYIVAVASLLALALGGAQAQEGGTKVGGDELRALVIGANVTHYSKSGSARRWTNEPDGTFVASGDSRQFTGATAFSVTGAGKWSISSDDKFCVAIEWKRVDEKWCSSIVKGADGSYYLGFVNPTQKIEFSR